MKVKTCTACATEKPIDEFPKHKTGKYGVNSRCRLCINAYARKYYAKRKAAGVCRVCGEATKGRVLCEPCNAKSYDSFKKSVKQNALLYLLKGRMSYAKKVGNPCDEDLRVEDLDRPEFCPYMMDLEDKEVLLDYSSTAYNQRNAVTLYLAEPELGYVKGNVFVISRVGLQLYKRERSGLGGWGENYKRPKKYSDWPEKFPTPRELKQEKQRLRPKRKAK